MPANSFLGQRERVAIVEAEARFVLSRALTYAEVVRAPAGGTEIVLPDGPGDGDYYVWVNPDESVGPSAPLTVGLSADAIAAGLTVQGASALSFTTPGTSGKVVFFDHSHAWQLVSLVGQPAASDALTVANWYINPQTGSDANAGTSAGAALKTEQRIVELWGLANPVLTQTTTIHWLDTEVIGAVSDVLSPIMVDGTNLVISGTPKVVASFAAGVVTPKSQVSPGSDLLVAGFTAAGLAPGQQVFNQTRGSYAMIHAIADGVATMCQPFLAAGLQTITSQPTVTQDDGWTEGNSLVVAALPYLNLKSLCPQGGDSDVEFSTGTVWVENVRVPDISGVPGTCSFAPTPIGCGMIFVNCAFDCFVWANGGLQALQMAFINCWLGGGCQLTFASMIGGSSNASGNEFTRFDNNVSVVDGNPIIHGEALVKGPYLRAGQVHFDDTVTLTHGGIMVIETSASVDTTTSIVWGDVAIILEGPNSAVQNDSGDTWQNCLKVASLQIEELTTGTSYAAGVFTDGIALTTANLDAHDGLQNPGTGSRFSGP